MIYTIIGLLILTVLIGLFWQVNPRSVLHRVGIFDRFGKRLSVIICIVTILVSVLPMGLSPVYNGEAVRHRDQYEAITESILNGKLSFDIEVDPHLLAMENPYSTRLREKENVKAEWDHAFYNGQYYMYFGIVPVFLVFIPLKLLTGSVPAAYHATQIFTALLIIGMFLLFRLLAKCFFKHVSLGIYLFSSVSLSLVSVWYLTAAPALYCTAIAAAICLEIWSLFFFFKAVYDTSSENKAVALATVGAVLGALAFGCRPPIALANVIALPLVLTFIRDRKIDGKINKKLLGKLVIAVLPYVIVGGLLMVYNQVRFDSPFEFGQSFQMTVADQSAYGNLLSRIDIKAMAYSVYYYLIGLFGNYDFTSYGVLVTFPLVTFAGVTIFSKKAFAKMRAEKLGVLMFTMIAAVIIIMLFNALCAPYPLPRYRMDFNWLLGICAFMFIGLRAETAKDPKVYSQHIVFFGAVTIVLCVVLVLVPYDFNFMEYYSPLSTKILKHILTFGIL